MVGGLESIVDSKEELALAIEAARQDLSEKIDFAGDLPEELSSVVEQELDPEAYDSQEYSVELQGKAGDYSYVKGYESDEEAYEAVVSYSAEHEVLEEVQQIEEDARQSNLCNEFDMGRFDPNKAHDLASLKLMYGQYMSFLLFAGDIKLS